MYLIDINGRLVNDNSVSAKVKRYEERCGKYNQEQINGITYDDLIESLTKVSKKEGYIGAKRLIREFNVKTLKDLPPCEYERFIVRAKQKYKPNK